MKVFIISWSGWDVIYTAGTASKARYKAFLDAKDAGYEPKLINIKVKRAKQYDYPKYEIMNSIGIEDAEIYKRKVLSGKNEH